ncbi:MAG: hypothetical protein IJO11_07625, partial [Alphaproteobacteria bacterium]|nr:hypothetical protein [Alphaproteobacteria bacterium]
DTDCQYSGTGFCCDDTEQVCRQCDETDCDKTKGLTLADGRCVCSGRKEWRQDERDSEPSCKCPINTPAEANPETCECPDGKDNVDEDGDGINECVISCPSDTGFTGLRNRTTGNCLCDTSKGYKAESETVGGVQMCVCDESRDYYQGPSGCLQCYQTTKTWCKKALTAEVNCDTIDESVWRCNYQKAEPGYSRIYNPTTKTFCGQYQVLRKNTSGFKCQRCDAYEPWNGSRTTISNICVCLGGAYLNVNNKCISSCEKGHIYPNIGCIRCSTGAVYANNGVCYGDLCDTDPDGLKTYWWYWWKEAVEGKCFQNFPNSTSNVNDPCSFVHGCRRGESILPYCDFSTKTASTCQCSTGGSVGEYCCSATTYPTSTGCTSCPMGQVPNSSRTGCESCPKNTITQNGKCVKCDKGYYPSSQQNRCLACPADRTTDEDGLTCSVCVDSLKVFNMITNKCECPPEISFEDPVNGNCILLEDEILEETEEKISGES